MANICTQNLYIVSATEYDMRDLLTVMADTFKRQTEIDLLADTSAFAGWREYARAMAMGALNYNKLCFLSDSPDSRSEGGSFRSGLIDGKPYIALDMALKWGPSFQVQEFCKGLDPSKYGFACINGGEYMCANGEDNEIAYIQCGEDFGDPFSGALWCGEYIELAKKYKGRASNDLHELALRILFECEEAEFFFWETSQEFGYGERSYDDESYEDDLDDRSYNWWVKIDWRKPSPEEIEKISSAAIDMLVAMPFANTLGGGWTKEGNRAAEKLIPGDTVVVSSKWGEDSADLYVSTTDGKRIGYLDYWIETQIDCDPTTTERIIALLLPYIKATVHELTPLSLRNTGVEGPIMSIRFDALPVDFAKVQSEVRSMLDKKLSDRELSSFSG